jgi:hypothetical protein
MAVRLSGLSAGRALLLRNIFTLTMKKIGPIYGRAEE